MQQRLISLLVLLLTLLLAGSCALRHTEPSIDIAAAQTPLRLTVASWNVENLFDTDDDPLNDGDDEFTPGSWRRWTPWRYSLKLKRLAEVIAKMNPDIICLTEVENRRVLQDLRAVLLEREQFNMPYILHRDGPDPRGIDVAFMSRHEAYRTNWLNNATRESIVCDFNIAGAPLTLVGNHWKSQIGKKAVSDAIRRQDALAVRAFLDQRLAVNSNAAILVTGDFNDQVSSPILVETAGFSPDERQVIAQAGSGLLFNLSGQLPLEERGTYWYNAGKRWESIDSISVTRGMLNHPDAAAPWRVVPGSYGIFRTRAQLDEEGLPLPFRYVRSKLKGNMYKHGYSDHLPLLVILQAAQLPDLDQQDKE